MFIYNCDYDFILQEKQLKNIIGLYGCVGWDHRDAWLHSAGASLFKDAKHICTISEERLSRVKHDGTYPTLSISYVLKEGKLKKNDIDVVGYTRSICSLFREDNIKKILQREFPNAEIRFVDHHLAHASAVFWTSPFESASILTFDGAGNAFDTQHQGLMLSETGFYGVGQKKNCTGIVVFKHFINGVNKKNEFPLGETYNYMSKNIYQMIEPEKAEKITNPYIFSEVAPGKIMGLSAYGNKNNVKLPSLFKRTIREYKDESYYFPSIYQNELPALEKMQKYEPADLAAWLQHQFTHALIDYFRGLNAFNVIQENLCLAGGCALNVLANKALLDEKIFKEIFVFPAANDSGLCFGAAIHCVQWHERDLNSKLSIELPFNLGSLGKIYSKEDMLEAIK